MESGILMKLDLRTAILYSKVDCLPEKIGENEEYLLCYEVNQAFVGDIEPERGAFLGEMVFLGRKTGDISAAEAGIGVLPAGEYLFTQYRSYLNSEERLDMAIEQHKDGLWERYKLGDRLFVRFLYEDGSPVTQFFRTLEA